MDWKKIGKRILFPHPAFTAILSVIALVLLVYGFIALETTHVFSILSYALSFYALMLVCLRVPDMIAFVRRFRRENKYYLLYRSDVKLRMNISLYGSFAFNAAYAVFQLWLGLWHHSAWFYSMACYYLLLAGMRILLARTIRNHAPGEEHTRQRDDEGLDVEVGNECALHKSEGQADSDRDQHRYPDVTIRFIQVDGTAHGDQSYHTTDGDIDPAGDHDDGHTDRRDDQSRIRI